MCYYVYVKPVLDKILSVLSALMTIFVLGTEITRIIFIEISMGSWLPETLVDNLYALDALCVVFLGYEMAAAFFAVANMKLTFLYTLNKKKQTDPSSLLYVATLCMRFAVPLVYNFMFLVDTASNTDAGAQTAFV